MGDSFLGKRLLGNEASGIVKIWMLRRVEEWILHRRDKYNNLLIFAIVLMPCPVIQNLAELFLDSLQVILPQHREMLSTSYVSSNTAPLGLSRPYKSISVNFRVLFRALHSLPCSSAQNLTQSSGSICGLMILSEQIDAR